MQEFTFDVPNFFNMGVNCADQVAIGRPDHPALIEIAAGGRTRRLSYAQLSRNSSGLASSLRKLGIKSGDRVALLLPQGIDVAVAHIAIYKLGAIAVPLAHVFQSDAISYRLMDSGACALITDTAGLLKTPALPTLKYRIAQDDLPTLVRQGDPDFAAVPTNADEPCLLIYTSGTTGQPKGTLHAHRVLIGHLAGFELHHQPLSRGVFWTPSDWAWAGGLLNLLFPALYYGQTVIAWPYQKFSPEAAYAIMQEHKITNAFIPPTALRMMQSVTPPELSLKSLSSAGESLDTQTYHWCRTALNVQVDEFYGQTECNYVLGSCARLGTTKAGSIGKTLPGARLRVDGEIMIHRDHPSMFLKYWNQPEATRDKFEGEWMRTGDSASQDEDGYITFIGRDDDIITSSSYRIGPVEIENCLLQHPDIALAAVVGKPDVLRTQIVKAFIVLKSNVEPNETLSENIQNFVRSKLSAHEYPREISFVDTLPMTSTGKIMRRVLRDEK